jgi:hypothetical protein
MANMFEISGQEKALVTARVGVTNVGPKWLHLTISDNIWFLQQAVSNMAKPADRGYLRLSTLSPTLST